MTTSAETMQQVIESYFPGGFTIRDESNAIVAQAAPELRNFSGHETILMAEDEAGLRKYVRHILEHKGYVVLEASNGNQALATAQLHRGPIHLLLTDLVMPEMGGFDLVGQFGSLRPHVPVLCMSGYSERLWRKGRSFQNHPNLLLSSIVSVRFVHPLLRDYRIFHVNVTDYFQNAMRAAFMKNS